MTGLSTSLPGGPTPQPIKWQALNALAAFVAGALLMAFFYSRPGSEYIGVPGHDSAYHIKMAAMIPEHGLVREFPWLQFCYFTNEGNDFVSHHYGFHVLLLPFVQLSKWITGDYMPGGRWAICTFVGLEFALAYFLLVSGRVRWPWIWLALLILLPHQFFIRHAYVRAISPSMAFMLLILLLAFRNRYILAGLAVGAYTHLYLGAVMYAPVIIAVYAAACLLGAKGDRRFPTAIVVSTAIGWTAGVLTYPYFQGMLDFLKVQVFGSGLTPDISVGREWNPYENVWWFARLVGFTLLIWFGAMALRLRLGPRLEAEGLTLLLLSIAFGLLTLKARRFIEYWPMFTLLSAAYLLRPILDQVHAWWLRTLETGTSSRKRLLTGAALAGGVALAAASVLLAIRSRAALDLYQAWQLWLVAAIPLTVILLQAAFTATRARASRLAGTAVAACAFLTATACAAADQLQEIHNSVRCMYNLPAISTMMDYIQANSEPGDVIFTDDWDIFPIFFYHNSYNHYIVGLDPKFTHHRRPDIWERYVKISRGRVPSTIEVDVHGQRQSLDVRLEDIRDHFGARFVITDAEHQALANKLNAAPEFAELVWPASEFRKTQGAPYRVFRIRRPGERYTPPDPTVFDRRGILYLSYLDPVSAKQGWGELVVDRSVGGEPITLGGKKHLNGLGTHAPSELRYRIPEGYTHFQAVVGVDDAQSGRGSAIASVLVDGEVVFKSGLLTGGEGERVNVSVAGASLLTLQLEPTDDGMRYDHVNWASARLVKMPK
jgi:hypothetical protein